MKWELKIPLLDVHFCEYLGAVELPNEVSNVWKSVVVWFSGKVEAVIVTTSLPRAIRYFNHVEVGCSQTGGLPAETHALHFSEGLLASFSFPGGSLLNLECAGGPVIFT